MSFITRSLVAILACTTVVSSTPTFSKRDNSTSTSNSTCTSITQRKSWHRMSDTEKKAYIDAELCLINTPADLGFNGTQSKFDELQYCHVWQSNVIHYSGQFLPWHRYFMYAHEHQLRTVCNYTGSQPYWEEALDTTNSSFQMGGSPVFDSDTGFGGSGVEEALVWFEDTVSS